MAEKAKVSDDLDPNPGKGDVDFKRAVLGATAVLCQLGEGASITDRWSGRVGFLRPTKQLRVLKVLMVLLGVIW